MRPDLNLTQQLRSELTQNLQIIINCAASVDLLVNIDTAVRVNVTGPLKLLQLAHECAKMEAFA